MSAPPERTVNIAWENRTTNVLQEIRVYVVAPDGYGTGRPTSSSSVTQ